MTAGDATDDTHGRSPQEAELARVYRHAATEAPPPALDARIRAQAREVLDGAHVRASRRWAIPVAVAATIVLSVGVVLEISRRGGFEGEDANVATAPASAPSPEAMLSRERAQPSTESAAQPRRKDLAGGERSVASASAPAQISAAKQTTDSTGLKKQQPSRDQKIAAAPAREGTTHADVTAVRVSGAPGAYYFSVTVRSPDTGCAQYADWWEVLDARGRLLYRRVLLHSHAGEQPFERSGGPVAIQPAAVVWVRAHMNPGGYGGAVLKGSVESGFKPATLPEDFAARLAKQPPLPDGCAF